MGKIIEFVYVSKKQVDEIGTYSYLKNVCRGRNKLALNFPNFNFW